MNAKEIFEDIFNGYAMERYEEHHWNEKQFNEVLAVLTKVLNNEKR